MQVCWQYTMKDWCSFFDIFPNAPDVRPWGWWVNLLVWTCGLVWPQGHDMKSSGHGIKDSNSWAEAGSLCTKRCDQCQTFEIATLMKTKEIVLWLIMKQMCQEKFCMYNTMEEVSFDDIKSAQAASNQPPQEMARDHRLNWLHLFPQPFWQRWLNFLE